MALVIPPNSNTFFDWTRTCHVSWVKTHQLPRPNKTHQLPRETTTWTLDSHVIGSCSLKQHQICGPAGVKQTISSQFCFYLWVGRYNKTLNDWSRGKQWVLFPLDCSLRLRLRGHWGSRGNKTDCFPWLIIKCLISTEWDLIMYA